MMAAPLADGVLLPRDLPLWQMARPYLDVRCNDEHTIIAYALARAFLRENPGADESVVLPAILLHDVGWKRIDPDLLLLAIGRNPTRKDLVRDHEVHGVKMAREILESHRPEGVDIDAVLAIIDGHDTTKNARSLNDAVVKDADKAWRATMHGMTTICGWYGTTLAEHVETLEKVSNPYMLTPAGRAFAEAMCASVKAQTMLDGYMGRTTND